MNVSAVNCTPIKPQVAFGNSVRSYDDVHYDTEYQDRYNQLTEFADKVDNDYVNSSNIKKPIAAFLSVGLAALVAFATGKLVASKASIIAEKVKLDLPSMLDNGLKKASNKVKTFGEKLKTEVPATKGQQVKNALGKAITFSEEKAKMVYKKLAYSGVKPTDSAEIIKQKAFANIGGITGLALGLPGFCAKDSNSDGVNDILQRGQNAYTGAKTKAAQALSECGKIAELVDILS